MLERTLLLIKPDGVERGLEAEIKKRLERADLKISRSQQLDITKDLAEELYRPHLGQPFYHGLIKLITSGPIICSIVEGDNAIARLREIMGATDPREALSGTIRGDLKEENIFTKDGTIKNIVHGSDSPESAEREIKIFFGGKS